jgi:hypothetical protein
VNNIEQNPLLGDSHDESVSSNPEPDYSRKRTPGTQEAIDRNVDTMIRNNAIRNRDEMIQPRGGSEELPEQR